MKKIAFFMMILSVTSMSHAATSLKKRVAHLEKQIALLARNETESWKKIQELNREIEQLEEKAVEQTNKQGNTTPVQQ